MIFIDTWAWQALAMPRKDGWSKVAMPVWRELSAGSKRLLTTWMVVDETINVVASYAGCGAAADFSDRILATPRIVIHPHDPRVRAAGVHLMRQRSDQAFSLTDAVSFLVMKSNGCGKAFTGDRHFRAAGFESIPDSGV